MSRFSWTKNQLFDFWSKSEFAPGRNLNFSKKTLFLM